MNTEIKVTAPPLGHVQQAVLNALTTGPKTTEDLARIVYDRTGTFEFNSILRAIRSLTTRHGFSFIRRRKGRVGGTGYLLEWRFA